MKGNVLLSWVARNNDPYERERDGSFVVDEQGKHIPGPTLNLLFDADSPYRDKVSDVILLARILPDAPKKAQDQERHIVEETAQEIQSHAEHIQIEKKYWPGTSPVDHRGIFAFLKARIPEIRRQYPGQELLINVSPGTPAMHTIWVLMAETGYIESPFVVVQTIPAKFRAPGEPAAIPVDVGIETSYKAYHASQPQRSSAEEEQVFWDPAQFKWVHSK